MGTMKKQDAIDHATNEFFDGMDSEYKEDFSCSEEFLREYAKRVLNFYVTPYSDKIKPINGKRKEKAR